MHTPCDDTSRRVSPRRLLLTLVLAALPLVLGSGWRSPTAGHAAAGDCGRIFDVSDAEAVLGAAPDPQDIEIVSGPGTLRCTYKVHQTVSGTLVSGSTTVSLFSLSKLKAVLQLWKKELCRSSAADACDLMINAVQAVEKNPLRAFQLVHRALAEAGDVQNLTGVFGGNPAFIWNASKPFNGSTALVYLEKQRKVIDVFCMDLTNPDRVRDPACARRGAKIVYANLVP